MLDQIHRFDRLAIDTETDGLYYPRNKAIGFSIATPDGRAEYWDLRQYPEMGYWLGFELRRFKGTVIGHDIKFDYKMLAAAGIRIPRERLEDTATRACLIDEHLHSYALDDLGKKYLKAGKETSIYQDLADVFGGKASRNVQMKHIHLADPQIVRPYAIQDAALTMALYDWQEPEIFQQGLECIVDLENRLTPHLLRSEMTGIRVDLDAAERAMNRLTPIINVLQTTLNRISGTELNVNSPPQIKALLAPGQRDNDWFINDVPIPSTPGGGPSLGANTLRELPGETVSMILKLRSMLKTRDTFLKKHILEHATGDWVYPKINQNKGPDGGTGTGRLSYTDPALQQIPSRDKRQAAIVKEVFLADEDDSWVDTDMASFEVRTFYHLIDNPTINDMFAKDPRTDAHGIVADITGLVRNATYGGEPNAKQLNLSMIFNQGQGATAEKLGLPWEWDAFEDKSGNVIRYKKAGMKAKRVIQEYHSKILGVKQLAEEATKRAKHRGFIFTHHGRHIRFPRGYKAYKASGLLIQATSADINKENWIILSEMLESEGSRIILNTHDSYSLNTPKGKEERIYKEAGELIKSSYPWFRIPLHLDLNGYGDSWAEALGLSKNEG